MCLLRAENSLLSCNILPGTSDHNRVLLDVEWDEILGEPKVERIVPLYHKTDILGLLAYLRERLNLWGGNGRCVEEIWKSYSDIIFEGMKPYAPQ
jgi:hypothetical protein